MHLFDYPLLVFLTSLLGLWMATIAGVSLSRRKPSLDHDERDDFTVLLGATLTLLGLIIGFTFSMAVSRYDLRKQYEEFEANAIGTEYARADLLPQEDTTKLRELLNEYLRLRIMFYETSGIFPRRVRGLHQLHIRTVEIQNQMWSMVYHPAAAQGTAILALATGGMNDVLNSEGYAQAAWWNRVPVAAWILMGAIAVCSSFLMGFGAGRTRQLLLWVLPCTLSISFFLIADIDSPRNGVIRVHPENLESLSQTLNAR